MGEVPLYVGTSALPPHGVQGSLANKGGTLSLTNFEKLFDCASTNKFCKGGTAKKGTHNICYDIVECLRTS